jgi:23S rRNA (cytosine1962-C5)-methyltransferase
MAQAEGATAIRGPAKAPPPPCYRRPMPPPSTPGGDAPAPALRDLINAAGSARAELLLRLHSERTDCYRLFHGSVEGRPGLAIDRYGPILLVQTWNTPLSPEDRETIAARWPTLRLATVHHGKVAAPPEAEPEEPLVAACKEGGLSFDATPRRRGGNPLLFLDLRAGRRQVRARARGCTVLNLFAYTCGVGVAALAGGAKEVWNVDTAAAALKIGRANSDRNGLDPAAFVTIREDAFAVTRQLGGLGIKGKARRRPFRRFRARTFDLTVLDPPKLASSPFGKVDVVNDYPSLLKPALLSTRPGGAMLVTNNDADVDEADWHETLRRCAAKAGRELRSLEPIPPDSDFPSPDGRTPLKMAWLGV